MSSSTTEQAANFASEQQSREDKTTAIAEEVTISSPDHPLWTMEIGAHTDDARKVLVKCIETIAVESIYEDTSRGPGLAKYA